MRKLTLKQLLEFKNEDYYGHLYSLHLTKSNYAEYGCDYRISGTMPVKIEKTRGRGKDKIALPIEGQTHIMFSMNGEVHRFWGKVSLGGE